MTNLQEIVNELRTLPPERLEKAANYIHRLQFDARIERKASLRRVAGSLTTEEAHEFKRIIQEGCEQIDERDW